MAQTISRREQRLHSILAILRSGVTTAEAISAALQASPRTIYRDIRLMKAAGAPIVGESGVGYMLRRRPTSTGDDSHG